MDPVIFLNHWWQELDRTILFNSIFFSLLLCCTLLYLLKLTGTSKLNLPPSPPKLPIIGNLHQISTQLHRSLQSLSEKYGPLMLLQLGNVPILIVSSAEIARQIMRTHDVVFASRPSTKVGNVLLYGCSDVALSPYGDYWRQAKKICVFELLSQKMVQKFQSVREEEVANMVEKIRLSCLNGAATDLSEMFITISNNIICRSALGRTYEGEEGNENFRNLAKTAIELVGAFSFEDWFPSLRWMDILTGLNARLNRTSKALNGFFDQVIEEHPALKCDDDSDKDFVDILLRVQKETMLDINFTRDNLKAIILDMFVAGTDTSGITMEWAMAELIKNPSSMKKAQEEVRRVVGEKSKVEKTDIDQMNYLKCVIKETLRLHALVLIPRETTASSKLGGYNIPAKTRVLINTWAIQREPKVWDNPEEFLPERFANLLEVDFKGQHNQLIPFGFGRRSCPGMFFGIAVVEIVLANLLYWFDWKLPDGAINDDLDMSDIFVMTIRKKIPLCLVPVAHSP